MKVWTRAKSKIKGSAKSLTVQFNTVLLALLPAVDYARQNADTVKQYLGNDWAKYAVMAALAVNILLRFKTNSDLADK